MTTFDFSSYRKNHFGSVKSQIQFSEISSVLQKRRSKKKGLMKCERVYGNKWERERERIMVEVEKRFEKVCVWEREEEGAGSISLSQNATYSWKRERSQKQRERERERWREKQTDIIPFILKWKDARERERGNERVWESSEWKREGLLLLRKKALVLLATSTCQDPKKSCTSFQKKIPVRRHNQVDCCWLLFLLKTLVSHLLLNKIERGIAFKTLIVQVKTSKHLFFSKVLNLNLCCCCSCCCNY